MLRRENEPVLLPALSGRNKVGLEKAARRRKSRLMDNAIGVKIEQLTTFFISLLHFVLVWMSIHKLACMVSRSSLLRLTYKYPRFLRVANTFLGRNVIAFKGTYLKMTINSNFLVWIITERLILMNIKLQSFTLCFTYRWYRFSSLANNPSGKNVILFSDKSLCWCMKR